MRALLLASALMAALSSKPSRSEPVGLLQGVDALSHLIRTESAHGRLFVLHFFATWCADCRREMPTIRTALLDAQREGASVAVVSLDQPADRHERVPAFLRRYRLAHPAFVLNAPDPDPVTKLIDRKWDGGLPSTFVFRDGKRVASFLGPITDTKAFARALHRLTQPAAAR